MTRVPKKQTTIAVSEESRAFLQAAKADIEREYGVSLTWEAFLYIFAMGYLAVVGLTRPVEVTCPYCGYSLKFSITRSLARISPPKVREKETRKCELCGSSEMIHIHHEGPEKVPHILCAYCHHSKHPDKSLKLFINKRPSSYWIGVSLGSIGRDFNISAKTVRTRAEEIGILPGDLSQEDESRLREELAKRYKRVPEREALDPKGLQFVMKKVQ